MKGSLSAQRLLLKLKWAMSTDCANKDSFLHGKAKSGNCIRCEHWLLRNIPPVELRRPKMFPSLNCISLLSDTLYKTRQWPKIFTWTYSKMVAFLAFPQSNGSPWARLLHLYFHEDFNCQYINDKLFCTVLKWSNTSRVSINKTPSVHNERCKSPVHFFYAIIASVFWPKTEILRRKIKNLMYEITGSFTCWYTRYMC
jgi:hypothetical protein